MGKCLAKKILELARAQYGFSEPHLGVDENGAVSIREYRPWTRIWVIGLLGKITLASARQRMAWNAKA